jgi:rubrerythrin
MECIRCGYVWNNRKAIPKQCPSCKQYYYNKEREYVKVDSKTDKQNEVIEFG